MALLALLAVSPLAAQSTGKLEGRIRDQAGAPVAGAQVRVEGTAYGAVADQRGYYFINNIPAGVIDVAAAFVGYRPVRVNGLRISAGQTITQDFQLEQQAVDIGELEVTAENPLVPRDAVTTKQTISGDFTAALPVDRIANVLALQPGVIQGPNGLTIRGGRPDEAVTYIDGVPVTPGGRGNAFAGPPGAGIQFPAQVDVSTSSLEEASVTTGGSSAEFGNAQSGVIAIQTRSGGSKWSGNFGVENDDIGGLNHSLGFTRLQGGIGGPLAKNLSFYLSGDLEGQKSAPFGMDNQKYPVFVPAGRDTTVPVVTGDFGDTTYVDVTRFAMYTGECDAFKSSANAGIRNNYGYSCRGARVPASAISTYRVQGRLQYTYGTGSRLALSFLRSQGQQREFDGTNSGIPALANPQQFFGVYNGNNVATLAWSQNLAKSADRALALELYASYQWDRSINGPLTTQGELDTRDPFGGFMIKPMKFRFDFDNFDITNLEQNFRLNSGRLSPYNLNSPGQYSLLDTYRNNPYGLQGALVPFWDGGGPTGRLSMYKEDRAVGKGNLDWQLDRYNRVKLGGEYTKYFMNAYSSNLTNQAFSDAYHEKPTRWNAFVEDRLDLGDVVLVGGLRYDWYKTGASRPYYTDSLGNRSWFPRISTMPGFDPSNPTAGFVADKSHDYLSPHVQVSFPVTTKTNFRLSYAHQVQQPDFQLILGGINTDVSVTNTNHTYGTDLDFGRTITFEFGVRHSFSEDMVLDVSAYNKDKLSDAAGRLISYYDPFLKQNTNIQVITNADFGNARGVDVRFDRRIGELFNGSLAYTYEEAKNTGSNPFSYLAFGSRILNAIVPGGRNPPAQAALTTNDNRPHNLAGQFAVNFPNNWKAGSTAGKVLENVGIFATFRLASGTPYTRCPIDDPQDNNVFSGGPCNRNIAGDFNGARLPSFKQFDLRVTKGFGFGGLDFTAYADVRNLFNFRNIAAVFAQTNDIVNAAEKDKIRRSELSSFAAEAARNGVLSADSTINLSFGGVADPRTGCGNWVGSDGVSASPNCVYLIRAEERYGNGDHLFTQAEQLRANDAFYAVVRGLSSFTGQPRQIRLGLEVNF
ncbi:MAG TPA: TonB-dependent receptor [Gemmatimonadales bacterium]|nr:TonB-dependent receptor [Gemmatimonadales bacterium]